MHKPPLVVLATWDVTRDEEATIDHRISVQPLLSLSLALVHNGLSVVHVLPLSCLARRAAFRFRIGARGMRILKWVYIVVVPLRHVVFNEEPSKIRYSSRRSTHKCFIFSALSKCHNPRFKYTLRKRKWQLIKVYTFNKLLITLNLWFLNRDYCKQNSFIYSMYSILFILI